MVLAYLALRRRPRTVSLHLHSTSQVHQLGFGSVRSTRRPDTTSNGRLRCAIRTRYGIVDDAACFSEPFLFVCFLLHSVSAAKSRTPLLSSCGCDSVVRCL